MITWMEALQTHLDSIRHHNGMGRRLKNAGPMPFDVDLRFAYI